MISPYGWQFFLLGQFVEETRSRLRIKNTLNLPPLPQAPDVSTGIIPHSADSSLRALLAPDVLSGPVSISGPSQWLNDDEKKDALDILGLMKNFCADIGLNFSSEIDRLMKRLEYTKKDEIVIYFTALQERIVDELKHISFVYVAPSRGQYYMQQELFGSEVSKKLPTIASDLSRPCGRI